MTDRHHNGLLAKIKSALRELTALRALPAAAAVLILAACASMGRPEGGPRDEDPPVFVTSTPLPGALNVKGQKLKITFDENVNVKDIMTKVVVSPAQKDMPVISSNGRTISVELRDTLKDSTTYTIDFSDAIRDLNEGNILDNFAIDFATGPAIDSLRISGMVFEARTLEPAQGMVVGVYSDLSDTAVTSLPMERVAKTNQYGQFTIRGLKPGNYNIFALDDRNRDWHWDRSENVAFFPVSLSPSTEQVEVADTLRSQAGEDSIVRRKAWHYLPDDILLTWFNENYRPQYLRDNKRPSRRYIELKFGAPVDSMPVLTVLNGPLAGGNLADLSVLETRAERDSMIYWLRDTVLVSQDSILLQARYRKTDSLDCLVWQTDTLKMFFRRQPVKEKKEKKKEKGDSLAADSLPQITFVDFKASTPGSQELNLPVRFEAPEPLEPISRDAWRLEVQRDTLWLPVADVSLEPDSVTPRGVILSASWEEGTKYRFTADSARIFNIYGEFNRPFKFEFTTKKLDDYGNIYLNLTDLTALQLPDSARVIVELLSSSDQPVATATVENGSAAFHYVAPATYYARAYIDIDHDGQWTTGNVGLKRLPEDVFYYPKKLVLRKNWDLEQDWSLLDTPVDLQKPKEIKKNKPKTKEPDQTGTDSDEDGEFGDGFDPEQGAWGNGSQYNNAGGRGGSNRRGGFGQGGMRTNRSF